MAHAICKTLEHTCTFLLSTAEYCNPIIVHRDQEGHYCPSRGCFFLSCRLESHLARSQPPSPQSTPEKGLKNSVDESDTENRYHIPH